MSLTSWPLPAPYLMPHLVIIWEIMMSLHIVNYHCPISPCQGRQLCISYICDSLIIRKKAVAPHSSTLAWKIPWMEEPGGLQSMGSLRVEHDFTFTFTFHFHALEKEMATHSSILAWRILGTGEPDGLPSMGSHRVGHDWSDLAAAIIRKLSWESVFCGFSWY